MKMRKIIAVLAAALMLFSILPISAMAADTYELASSIAVGDKIIIFAVNDNAVLSTTQNGNNRGKTDATPNGTAITLTDAMQVITVEAGLTEGTYAFNVGNGYLFAASSSKNYLRTETTLTANSSWSVSIDESGVATIKATGSNTRNWLRYNNGSSIFACYGSGQNDIAIYKLPTGGTDEPECEHEYVSEETAAATCTEDGELTYTCSLCGDSYTEVIAASGHDYVDGVCSVCGAEEPAISEHTIDFSSDAQRVSLSTTAQVWQNGVLKVTNNKGSSPTNIADYSNPARFYKSSQIVIECANMTSLVVDATDIGSGYLWEGTLDDAGLTYTVSEKVYTITFAEPVDSITLTAANQVRANSITAVVEKQGDSDCEHEYTSVETEPTCGAAGVITYTCSLCGDSYTEEGAPATGEHTNDGYVCSVCGAIDYPEEGDELTISEATALGVAHPSNSYSENKYYVTGEITGYYGDKYATYGNVYIKDAEGNSLLIYGLYSADGSTRYDAMEVQPVIGDTITVYGVIGSFNSTAQMKSGWVTEHIAHEHAYDHSEDTDCNVCGAIRPVDYMISNFDGNSISEDVSGLAFKYTMEISGIGIKAGKYTQADYTNATVTLNSVSEPVKVLGMGAIVSNNYDPTLIEYVDGKHVIDVPCVYLCDLEEDTASFAVRIINIPETGKDTDISVRPYLIYEDQFGNVIYWYGLEDCISYNQVAG